MLFVMIISIHIVTYSIRYDFVYYQTKSTCVDYKLLGKNAHSIYVCMCLEYAHSILLHKLPCKRMVDRLLKRKISKSILLT
jgi:hypothetical protein